MQNCWIDANKELPKEKSCIVKVRLENLTETKAYFYADMISWIAYYGHKTSNFWDKDTKEPLFNVTHWLKNKEID